MQVIDKPPYWNCRWNSTMGGVVSERRQLSHDRRSWQEILRYRIRGPGFYCEFLCVFFDKIGPKVFDLD